MSAKPSICFVSMEVYPNLRPGVAEEAGGAGFQIVQIANPRSSQLSRRVMETRYGQGCQLHPRSLSSYGDAIATWRLLCQI